MPKSSLSPDTILAWVNLGTQLFKIGASTAEQLGWLMKLVHGPLKDSEIQDVLKQIEAKALSLADAADKDAGVQREGEGL